MPGGGPSAKGEQFRRYMVAAVAVALAILLRLSLDPLLNTRFPFATLFFAVLISAWYGGLGPALFATIVGGTGGAWYLLPPRHTFELWDLESIGGLSLYLTVGLGISLIGGVMHRSQRQALAAALEAEAQREKLQVTLRSIGDGVIVTDAKGLVTALNAVAEELTGWTSVQAQGHPLTDVFHIVNEISRSTVANPVARVLAEGRIVGLANHTVLVTKDGREAPIDDSAAPIRGADGDIIGVVLVFRDATERRHAEVELRRSEQLLSDFFENANVGLHVVSPEGIILRANQSELDLLGYRREEYVGRPFAYFHTDPETIDAILTALHTGASITNRPARLRAKDGTLKDVLINSSPYREHGEIVHTRCFTLDITDRARAREVESLLAEVVTSSNVAIITKTLDGAITSWNAAAERIFGYTAMEAIGTSIIKIIPTELQHEEETFLGRLRRGERIENAETRRITKDGRLLDVSLTISPVRDSQGMVVGASTVARDITDHKRFETALRDSEERFRTLADNIAQFAWMANAEGWIEWYNRRWFEFTGTTLEEMRGWGWTKVHHPEHVDGVVARIKRCWETGEVWEDLFPLRGAEGEYRWFLSRAIPIRDEHGAVSRWFGTNTDVTELREAQEALRQAHVRKDEFLATLAHELRNPLAPVRSALEIMERAKGDAAVIEQARAMIDRQMAHFERLVDDLLDVSRITRDKLELRLQSVGLHSVVQQAVEACRPLVDHMGHELDVRLPEQPIHLHVDAVRLAQILTNLLNNACKYTHRGGHIRLRAHADGGQAVISVQDDGQGISAELLPRVFEMFTQLVRPVEASHGGLGIGLTLVKRLVEMHGGTVEALSDGPGRGSEFRVRLPLPTAGAAPPLRPDSSTSDNGLPGSPVSKRILVVDDNRDAAQTLAMLLKLSGHETRVAFDGSAALELAEAFRPQLAFLDIGLPKLSGHEVARRIRGMSWGQSMCLVALTGWGHEDERRKSSEAGFDHHLVKPVHQSDLTTLLTSLDAR